MTNTLISIIPRRKVSLSTAVTAAVAAMSFGTTTSTTTGLMRGAMAFSVDRNSIDHRHCNHLSHPAIQTVSQFQTILYSASSSSSSPPSSTLDEGSVVFGESANDESKPDLPSITGTTTKRLFLVRHGEVINPGGDRPVYYGAMDVPLSSLGKEEAKAAAMYLQNYNEDIDLVVSSPLSRAVYGADQVMDLLSTATTRNSNKSLPLQTMNEGFRELDRGAWCGKTKDEIGQEAMDRFDACDESVTPEGGESYPYLKRRVLKARDEVLNELQPGRAAVIVSHLQVTRCILSTALGLPTHEMAGLKIATASVTCIDYNAVDDDIMSTVQYQSFKPDVGLAQSKDGAN